MKPVFTPSTHTYLTPNCIKKKKTIIINLNSHTLRASHSKTTQKPHISHESKLSSSKDQDSQHENFQNFIPSSSKIWNTKFKKTWQNYWSHLEHLKVQPMTTIQTINIHLEPIIKRKIPNALSKDTNLHTNKLALKSFHSHSRQYQRICINNLKSPITSKKEL